ARKSGSLFKRLNHNPVTKLKALKRLDIIDKPFNSTNTEPYGVSSPFSLPPFDSLAPLPLPESTPPFCVYPPFPPQPPPSTTVPSPTGEALVPPSPPSSSPTLPTPSPTGTTPSPIGTTPPSPIIGMTPPSPTGTTPSSPTSVPSPTQPGIGPGPPSDVPSPPESPTYVPSPTEPILIPPSYEPSPPSYVPSPPSNFPSPSGGVVPSPTGGFTPSPPVFEPPVVYPPPTVPPPPHTGPSTALWCVAKPTVPDPIIQEAMNYACGSGADCDSLQPSGSCFQPNTLFAHASYAFNSYWQRTKVAGGMCEFGGTAMLVTVDPSYDGCHFLYY
ncbi:hypothetical protein RJ639_000923, partial [Escallonia herrerae]